MHHGSPSAELKRDCDAVQIPVGNTVVLPAGTAFDLAQQLGGSCTIRAMGGLFRVSPENLDALGLDPAPASGSESLPDASDAGFSEERVWQALRSCFDPEIPVNIVDLGLIYDLVAEPMDSGDGWRVQVKMTLTAPGCGMGTVIAGDAREKIQLLPGVREARVDVVWDPPWHQSMISAEGRRILGLE